MRGSTTRLSRHLCCRLHGNEINGLSGVVAVVVVAVVVVVALLLELERLDRVVAVVVAEWGTGCDGEGKVSARVHPPWAGARSGRQRGAR